MELIPGKCYRIYNDKYPDWLHIPTEVSKGVTTTGHFIILNDISGSYYCHASFGVILNKIVELASNEESRWLSICLEYDKTIPIKELREWKNY